MTHTATDIDELGRCARELDDWMLQRAFPRWSTAGLHPSGGFYEALDFNGLPLPSNESRVRVQARQIFCYALAHRRGWNPPLAVDILGNALALLKTAGLGPAGVGGRRLNLVAKTLTDPTPDLYDNAFIVLALASARPALGGELIDAAVSALLRDLDAELAYPDGQGYREYLPAPDFRLQNPHMHLFESMLALYAATRDPAVRKRADDLVAFIDATFFDHDHGVVREIAGSEDPADSGYYEPGHSLEWVWLLGLRARLLDAALPPFALKLYEHALGALNADGFAPMRVSVANQPIDTSCRLWSQTESLKAHLAIAELGDEQSSAAALKRANACAQSLLSTWLTPTPAGGWLDHFDGDGKLIATDMPASSGYHIFLAVDELVRVAAIMRERSYGA